MARKEFSGVCALFFLTNGAFGDKIVQNRTIGEDACARRFFGRVALLRRLYTRRFAELLRETGLNQAEMDVLLFLANNPPYDTARDIVRRRGLAKSHVSAAVESLAEKGLLARVYRDGNRKTVHLELSLPRRGRIARGQALQTAFFDECWQGLIRDGAAGSGGFPPPILTI